MELYQAIVKMEEDGSVDHGVLQVCLTNVYSCIYAGLLTTFSSPFASAISSGSC
jgi:hypothetical protein